MTRGLATILLAVAVAIGSWGEDKPDEKELRFWLENLFWHHRFSDEEAAGALNRSAEEVKELKKKFGLGAEPAQPTRERILVLPYPGGRHPRIGFLDGAVNPQRDTKASVFLPWKGSEKDYVVIDLPEALWSNLGLTYLAHTHIPTIWDKAGVKLDPIDWSRKPDGGLESKRTLPNGLEFAARVQPQQDSAGLELKLKNGTAEQLTGLRAQICVLLKGAADFNAQTNANKVIDGAVAAVKSADGKRWIVTAWERGRAWGNPPCPCLHSDPVFPDLEPGEEAAARGTLFFYEGEDPRGEAERRLRGLVETRLAETPESAGVRIALDHGDRADVDATIGEAPAPSFRLLLPEAVLAEGKPLASGVHTAAGAWIEAKGAWQGAIRPGEAVECAVRLEPRRGDVLIAILVKNVSARAFEDVRVDLCANLCRLPKTWEKEWSNRDFIPASVPLNRDEQGKYWYRELTPRRLKAWSPEEGWIEMHPRPEQADRLPENPYEAQLGAGDRSLACAVPSLDGKRFFYQAWAAKRSRHQSPFSGNACMHLRPQVAERLEPGELAVLLGAAGVFAGGAEDLARHFEKLCASAPAVDAAGRPFILKRGTIDLDLVETTPILFQGRAWRFEWVREGYWNNALRQNHFRFVDLATGAATEPFARGHDFGSAFADGDTMYVTGTWERREVRVFASRDLKSWETWPAINRPGYGIFNTSVTKAGEEYVLMFEIDKPLEEAGAAFTARFAKSRDFRRWEITPPECNYARDRYTAPHCLRWLDGWFYDFYLEAHEGYEMRVVRSRDLVRWEPSPLNPVLRASPEDKLIANPRLSEEQRRKIAAARNINNSDIDFCERNGRLLINYSWGNQQGIEFLAEAVYPGTLEQFLRGWFPGR
ncbi:MAG: hypothetical protein HY717_20565 [Planctomycetes bacterium]|nr:hypothetical protein [Planctomycetota bacterium]